MTKECKIPYRKDGYIGTIELANLTGMTQRNASRFAKEHHIAWKYASGDGIRGRRSVWSEEDVLKLLGKKVNNRVDFLFKIYNELCRSGRLTEMDLMKVHEIFFK